jgi:hypothetical protein
MAIQSSVPQTRRALLAAAAGAAAATVVSAIDHPEPARAGTDGDVVLGALNTATAPTEIEITANESDVLVVRGTEASRVITGSNPDYGTGVLGISTDGIGVEGSSQRGSAVLGVSETGTGVTGHVTLSGVGVHGHSFSDGGTGVLASAEAGTALRVSGRARFSRSGRVSIPAGKSVVDVDLAPLGGLSGTPLCFANLTSHRPGTWVVAVRPNDPSTGKLRIYLNRAVTSATFAVWLVLN